MKRRKFKASKKEPIAKKNKISQGLAIAALVLNIFIFPGLGTLIGGEIRIGIWQLALGIISLPLMMILIGIPLLIGVWIWGIVSGIQLVKESQ